MSDSGAGEWEGFSVRSPVSSVSTDELLQMLMDRTGGPDVSVCGPHNFSDHELLRLLRTTAGAWSVVIKSPNTPWAPPLDGGDWFFDDGTAVGETTS